MLANPPTKSKRGAGHASDPCGTASIIFCVLNKVKSRATSCFEVKSPREARLDSTQLTTALDDLFPTESQPKCSAIDLLLF